MKAATALLVSGFAAQQVAATWNRNAGFFNSPKYAKNDCSDKQKGGFNWSDLKDGDTDFKYGDFNYPGWQCSSSFGKRDALTKRSFNPRCIKNKVKKDKPASFDCEDKPDGFSVKEIQVSVEYKTNLEFHYGMPDGSKCKHVVPCEAEGTTVQNTQCGGAKTVEVYLGHNDDNEKEDCEIGFHEITFDCDDSTTYQPPPSVVYPPETPSSTPAASSTPIESSPAYTPPAEESTTVSPPPESTPVESQPGYTPPAVSTPVSSPAFYGNSSVPVETPVYTPSLPGYEQPPQSTPAEVPSTTADSEQPSSTPGAEYPASTPDVEYPASTPGAEYPASTPGAEYSASTPGHEQATSSAPEYPITSTPAESTASGPAPPKSTPVSPPGGYSPPSCLPKCMNTWLQINSDCKDNTDSACYCKNPDFTKSVIECVQAWAQDDKELQDSLQYLIGICADYVPENPAIVTDCPPIVNNPPSQPTPAYTASSAPVPSVPAAEYPASSAPVPSVPAGEYPVSSAPAPSVPAGEYPASSPPTHQTTAASEYTASSTHVPSVPAGGYPVSSAPAPSAPAPEVPCTTLTYNDQTYTVPQVYFTTQQPNAPGVNPNEPVALVPGNTPVAVPAQTTAAPAPYPTSLGTVTVPAGTTGLIPTNPAQFTGAASPIKIEYRHAFLGAALAFFAL